MILTCQQCATDFERPKVQKYCSVACKRKGMVGMKFPNRKFKPYHHPGPAPLPAGTRRVAAGGYIKVRLPDGVTNPARSTQAGRWMLEHRYVMQQMLGRPLTADETVHHINGVVDDNRPENLQLRTGRHGKGVRHVCQDCGSVNVMPAPLGV